MKKILCLVPYTFLPAKTGGQKCISSLYNELSKYYNLIVVGTESNDASKAKFDLRKLFSSSTLRYINPIVLLKLRKIIKVEKPEYLQIEHPYMGWMAVLLQKLTGIKLIVRSHNIEGLRFKNLNKWWWRILLKYESWVYDKADINYFISDADKRYAIDNFRLDQDKCYTITYGIDQTEPPTEEQHLHAKRLLTTNHNLSLNDTLVLFNGAFAYQPNINALNNLVKEIFPLTKSSTKKSFKLIICGKDIPEKIVANTIDTDIIFAGFVPDINVYLTGASMFVNPITEGGGIKTKLVEALGFNLTCVSYISGAIGVEKEVCGEKLLLVNDNEKAAFAAAVIEASNIRSAIPDSYYDQFSNKNIIEKIKSIL